MNCFEVLGIERTDEVKKIKRAYAAKAKECHPEEYPEEFQILHDAYEEALSTARQMKTEPEQSRSSSEREGTAAQPELGKAAPAQSTNSEWEEEFERIADASDRGGLNWCVRQIIEECRNLYLNETERGKLYHWKDLLEEPRYAEVFRTKEFVTAWYEFLESHHLFTYRIWMYFSSQDGLRFSGEPYGVQRFPYQSYIEQTQSAEAYRETTYTGSGKKQEAGPTAKTAGGKRKLSPVVKALFYAAALVGSAIGGGVLGVIAGLIFG